MYVDLRAETLLGVFLDALQDADGVGLQLVDGHSIRRVERQSNHGLLCGEVDADHSIVVGYLARL